MPKNRHIAIIANAFYGLAIVLFVEEPAIRAAGCIILSIGLLAATWEGK